MEVDTETGEVEILKITAVHDCGKAINPLLTEGQVEGGVAMGVGFGMMEEMVVENGRVKNPQFTDYVLPTALDVPEIVTRSSNDPNRPAPSEPRESASLRCCRRRRPSSMPSRMRSAFASGTCRQRRRRSLRALRQNRPAKAFLIFDFRFSI